MLCCIILFSIILCPGESDAALNSRERKKKGLHRSGDNNDAPFWETKSAISRRDPAAVAHATPNAENITIFHNNYLRTVMATRITAATTHLSVSGFYYVQGMVTLTSTLTVSCNAQVILTDGCLLEVSVKGFNESAIHVAKDANLVIWGQKDGSGTLKAQGGSNRPGIGGFFEVTGFDGFDNVGSFWIYGGTVVSTGGVHGAGIGSGGYGKGAVVVVTGGTVVAQGGLFGAAIGTGRHDFYEGQDILIAKVTITGGSVHAVGGIYTSDDIGIGGDWGGDRGLGYVILTDSNGHNGHNVYLNTLTVGTPALANRPVTAVRIGGHESYNITDVVTDGEGKVYLYLPDSNRSNADVELVVDGLSYQGRYTRYSDHNNSEVLALKGKSAAKPESGTSALTIVPVVLIVLVVLLGTLVVVFVIMGVLGWRKYKAIRDKKEHSYEMEHDSLHDNATGAGTDTGTGTGTGTGMGTDADVGVGVE